MGWSVLKWLLQKTEYLETINPVLAVRDRVLTITFNIYGVECSEVVTAKDGVF